MNIEFLNIVKHIVTTHGETILTEPQKLKRFVNDLAQDVPKAERLTFGKCIEYSAYNALKKCVQLNEKQKVKLALAQKIHEEDGMDKSLCVAALDMLDVIILGENEAAQIMHSTPPVDKTSPLKPIKPKRSALRIVGCIAALFIVFLLYMLKEAVPDIFMNKALEETANLRKKSLPFTPPVLESGWERISLPGIGSIDIPSNMEQKAGKFADLTKEYYKNHNTNSDSIIFQQKGLNDFSQESYQNYARVIIQTKFGNPGDFSSLYFPFPQYQTNEIKELNAQLKASTITENSQIGIKILIWNAASFKTINGMSCIHYSFMRQLNNRPIVLVNNYLFQNINSMYFLTLSYQQEKSVEWQADFNKILNSFRITNINSEDDE